MIGVLGGGQLAQMLTEAATKRNIEIAIQTPTKNDPATLNAKKIIHTKNNDTNAIKEMSKYCRSITFENEWISIDKFASLEKEGVKFIPSIKSIAPLVDKVTQRLLLKDLNIPVSEWILLSEINESDNKLPNGFTFPLMAKASKGGYDGKGTRVLNDFNDLHNLINLVKTDSWFLEKWVNYKKEFSLVASRDKYGKFRTFPLVETKQSNQICDFVLAPAEVSHQVNMMAYNILLSIFTELEYVGIIAIEFFYGDGGLVVNEIAPRTHNSAHFTIEACESSQFDQQLCIAAELDVPGTTMSTPGALMVNLLGLSNSNPEKLAKRLELLREIEDINLHWYGKKEEKPGRKLGHATFLLKNKNTDLRRQEAMNLLNKVRAIWPKN